MIFLNTNPINHSLALNSSVTPPGPQDESQTASLASQGFLVWPVRASQRRVLPDPCTLCALANAELISVPLVQEALCHSESVACAGPSAWRESLFRTPELMLDIPPLGKPRLPQCRASYSPQHLDRIDLSSSFPLRMVSNLKTGIESYIHHCVACDSSEFQDLPTANFMVK